MSDQLLTLDVWDKRKFNKPHDIRTLRRWVREGRIYPKPEKVGREYQVRPDAVYLPKQGAEPVTVIESKDPIVNEILSGKTQNRRQA